MGRIGEKKLQSEIDENVPPIITYNDEGHKILEYNYQGYKITGTVLNKISDEAIQAANKAYNELFYKFNPQEDL